MQQLYDAAVKRIAQAAAPSLFDADPKKEFHFEDFPALKKEMEALMQDLGSSLQANIEDGDQESWTLSNTKNDAMVDSIIGKKKLPAKTVKAWKHPHLEALNAFIARKEAGMNPAAGSGTSPSSSRAKWSSPWNWAWAKERVLPL